MSIVTRRRVPWHEHALWLLIVAAILVPLIVATAYNGGGK